VSSYWPPGLLVHLVRHPAHALVLARAGWRFRANDWWRHAPFLPLPDAHYWDFRMVTFGGTSRDLTPEAMVAAAQWSLCQSVRR
jgi:hypothetical protein